MKMKVCIIGILFALCASGCNKTPDIPEPDFGTETGVDTTSQESTEILIPPNGEIHYTDAELQIVEEALGNRENAQEIMKQLNCFGIYDIVRADLLVAGEDQELEVETADKRVFVVHYRSKNYYIQAIEKDGDYIYYQYY